MDDHGKYIRLFGLLFFTFLGIIAGLILLMLGLRLMFGALSFIPGFYNVFTLFIICVPAVLFISVYVIYYLRTKQHKKKGVRIFSMLIFAVALLAWIYFWISDLILFFRYFKNSISEYSTFNLAFLAANVFCIFLVGIVQALNAEKEVDWMQRSRADEQL